MTNPSRIAFVGTNTDEADDGVFMFRLDETGRLEELAAVSGGVNPSFLSPDSQGERLYVANRPAGGGNVVAYDIDRSEERLARLNEVPTHGDGTPCYCTVDATDRCVLTAQYGGGSITALPIKPDGRVGAASAVRYHEGSGPDPDRQTSPHPHAIRPGPDNEVAYVPDLGVDRVYIYDFDPAGPSLTPADCGPVDVYPGAGPRHLDFHPNGDHVYVINELDSTLTAFDRDAETGDLDEIATVDTLPTDYDGENTTADVHVHPDGDLLYGSNRGHDSIAIFELDKAGRPTLMGTESTRGECPRNFAIDPTGQWLFAENQNSDTIVTFRIESDGELRATGEVADVPAPVCMRFLGDA